MADDRRPVDPAAARPEHEPRPGFDPVHPANDPAVARDPAAGPRTNTTVVNSGGRSSMMIAAVIAVIAIIAALIAMNWDWGSPQATAPADPAVVEQETAPAAGDQTAPPADDPAATTAPTDTAPADADTAPADEPVPADEIE